MKKNVVAVILNYNDKENTIRLSQCLEKYTVIDKIIVVDNCSPNNDILSLNKLSSKKIDVISSDKNGGYSYGNNYALKYIEKKYGVFKYIIISNPDIEVEESAIVKTIDYLEHNNRIAIASPRIYDKYGNKYILSGWKIREIRDDIFLQSRLTTKLFVKFPWKRMYDEKYQDKDYSVCDCLSGAFFVVKGHLFKEIGYFDEKLFLFGEEDILGKKFNNLGYHGCVLNTCKVIHYESVSVKRTFDRPKTLKILYKSLRYYYKKYDRNTGFFKLFLYDIIYLYGTLESRINNILNKFSFLKKLKYNIKKIYHMILTKSRLNKLETLPKNNKKNILILTNYWEDELEHRKNLGIPSWIANEIIKKSNSDYNFHIMYAIGNTYRLTSYYDNNHYTNVIGFFSQNNNINSRYYNKIVDNIIKKININLIHICTIMNHYPDVSKVLIKNHVPYYVSVLDYQFYNPNYIYYNIDHKLASKKYKKEYKWNHSIQKLFDNSQKIIFDNIVSLNKYRKKFDIKNTIVIQSTLNSNYIKKIKANLKNNLNIAFLGCINNVQEIEYITGLLEYIYNQKNSNRINCYFIGNYNLKIEKKYSNVHCLGEYEKDNISEIFKKYDINLSCFFKQHDYACSLVLYEAYLLGIPIFSTDKSKLYNEFIIDNRCGWIIESNLAYLKIYEKLIYILDNKKNCYDKLICNLNIKKNNTINKYLDLYCEVFNENK